MRAIRDAGASRTAVVIGTAPLLSAGLALLFLDEPLRPALAVATIAIVLGGALLVWEPSRPPYFRAVGILLALLAATLFAVRDNLVRWVSLDSDADPLLAATVSLGAASLALLAYLVIDETSPTREKADQRCTTGVRSCGRLPRASPTSHSSWPSRAGA